MKEDIQVLFVDDETALLDQAKIFLEKENERLDVITTSSAIEGLELLDDDFDIIVSDYQMPEMDGLEFLEKIREEMDDDIPFIMFTGKGREDVAMRALNLGAQRYIQKGGSSKSQFAVLADSIVQEWRSKKSEKEVKENEERYRRLFESAQDGMLIIDAETGVIKDANPYIQELLHYSKEELVGKNLWEIGSFKNVAENKERFEELIEEGYIRYEDMPLKTKEGDEAPVEFVSNTYDVGENKVVQCNIRDVTERKIAEERFEKSERRFKKIYNASPDPTFLLDEKGVFQDVNESAVKKLGYEKEEILGKSIGEAPFLSKKYQEKIMSRFKRRKKGENIPPYEVELTTKQGDVAKAEINVAVFKEKSFEGEVVIARDITERKKAKEKLVQAKEDYERLIEGMKDAVFIHDMDGNFLKVNQEAVDRLGYTREELLEKGPEDIDASPHSEEIKEKIKDIEDEKELIFETVHVTKKGRKIPEEINSSYISYQGEPAVLSVARNIKDREEREKELNLLYSILRLSQKPEIELENIFEKTVEMIPDAFQYPEVTRAKIIFDEEEYRCDDYEESERKLENELSIDESVRGRIQVNCLEERPKEDVGVYLEEEVQLLEAVADILTSIVKREERKQQLIDSEERYRSMIENSVLGVAITDLEDELIFANDRFAEIVGYNKDDLIGKNVSEITSEDVYERISGKTKSRKEGLSEVYETQLKKKNDETVNVIMGATPYRDSKGEVSGTVGYVQDITERKEAEKREEFLHSLLRHDIRNKIQVIEGYLHLMKENVDFSRDAEEYLLKAQKGVRSSVELIEKIRTLREASNEDIGEISMESTLHDAVSSLKDQMMDINLDISMNCENDCRVQAGPLLQEVFSNIIENSIKYSEGAKINIHIEETDDEGVCIIEDDGKGISDEKKDKIFQRGFTTDADRGTGLGLFLVDKLINIYDGKIDVKDSELGGARFEVRLKKV